MAFSSDGAVLASAAEDNTIKLWDTAGGKERATLDGPLRHGPLPGLCPAGGPASGAGTRRSRSGTSRPARTRPGLRGHTEPSTPWHSPPPEISSPPLAMTSVSGSGRPPAGPSARDDFTPGRISGKEFHAVCSATRHGWDKVNSVTWHRALCHLSPLHTLDQEFLPLGGIGEGDLPSPSRKVFLFDDRLVAIQRDLSARTTSSFLGSAR